MDYIVNLGADAAVALAPFAEPLKELRLVGTLTGILLAVTAIVAAREQVWERLRASALVLLTGFVASGVLIAVVVLPALERFKVSEPIARAINAGDG